MNKMWDEVQTLAKLTKKYFLYNYNPKTSFFNNT